MGILKGTHFLHSSSHLITPAHHASDIITRMIPDAQTTVPAMTVIHRV